MDLVALGGGKEAFFRGREQPDARAEAGREAGTLAEVTV